MHSHRSGIIAAALLGVLAGCTAKSENAGSVDTAAETAKTCKHVVEVAGKTVTDSVVLEKVAIDCDATLTEVAKRHASLSECMLAASTVEEIAACETPAQSYRSVLSAAGPNHEAVCKHVMDIMQAEMGDAGAVSDSELEEFTKKCVKDIQKEQEKLGDEKFLEMSKCVMNAQKMEDLMKCEQDD